MIKSARTLSWAFTIGWLLGLLLAVVEASLVLGGHVRPPSSMLIHGLLTVGLYPVFAGLVALVLGLIPPLGKPSRLLTVLFFFILSPWIMSIVFPRAPFQLLLRPMNLPKTVGIVCFALLAAREVGRKAHLLTRIRLPFIGIALFSLVLFAATAVLHWWSGRPVSEPQHASSSPTGRPNALLITIDTLRKDEVGVFGATPSITPTIDSLAAAGVSFHQATGSAPWTLSSLATIHTGHYPSTTGVFTGKNRLPPGFPTLAHILADAGYHTRAIGRNTWLEPRFGLGQGFEVYDSGGPEEPASARGRRFLVERIAQPKQSAPRDAGGDASGAASREVAEKACAFLRDYIVRMPFFLWLHFNNVHAPYEPEGDYLPPLDGYDGPFTYNSGTVVRLRIGNRLTTRDKTRLRELYRGEIRYVDRLINGVLSTLRAAGLAPSTMVVLASDHGEEFWDHGSVMHGHTLFRELLEVPFMISWPERIQPRQHIDTPCSLVDLVPTVLGLLGIEYDLPLPGAKLLAQPFAQERPRFAEGLEFFEEQKSVIYRGWKLITYQETEREELFCLSADPGESYDRFRERPDIAAELTDSLSTHLERCRYHADRLRLDRAASTVRLTPQLKERLRAQGYIE